MIQGLPDDSIFGPPGPRFPLGRLLITPGARDLLASLSINPSRLLDRHAGGDWGEVDKGDWELNDQSVVQGTRILSSFRTNGDRVWIITEADRSATTILLPSEY